MNTYFAGLDWASQIHAVCVIDERGGVCERFEITHDADGLADLKRRLIHFGRPPIAIERPSGLVVDTLVEAGFTVVPIHPNAVKATRPRYRSHGAKSDASDAYLLADLLRTDGHRFKPLAPQGDDIRALRALVRGRDDLVATRVQLANQLRSLLESFWPGAAAIFAEVDSPIAMAFIARYPTPDSAARLGPKRLAAFCAQHAYSGRRSPEELLLRLHEAPRGVCAELEMDAKGELARSLARTLSTLVDQIRILSSRIEHHVATLDGMEAVDELVDHDPLAVGDQSATWDGTGVNFAIYSEHATSIELCLFDSPDATRESARMPFTEQTDMVWLYDLDRRAAACAECHVGGAHGDVNHDLIAAGHPRLDHLAAGRFQ